VLEMSIAPTLVDPGDERLLDIPSNGGQNGHALFCIRLVSESFVKSGPRGEACWIITLAKLTDVALGNSSSDLNSTLPVVLQLAIQGLGQFTEGHGLSTRPDMLGGFLRLLVTLVEHENEDGAVAVRSVAEVCGQVAFLALAVDDVTVLQEALSWWRLILTRRSLYDIAVRVLQHIGGSLFVGDALLLTVFLSCSTRKCTQLAADVLFHLQRPTDPIPALTSVPLSEGDKAVVRSAISSSVGTGVVSNIRKVFYDVRRLSRREIRAEAIFGAMSKP
jgi:class 3 adenylate cyclase